MADSAYDSYFTQFSTPAGRHSAVYSVIGEKMPAYCVSALVGLQTSKIVKNIFFMCYEEFFVSVNI